MESFHILAHLVQPSEWVLMSRVVGQYSSLQIWHSALVCAFRSVTTRLSFRMEVRTATLQFLELLATSLSLLGHLCHRFQQFKIHRRLVYWCSALVLGPLDAGSSHFDFRFRTFRHRWCLRLASCGPCTVSVLVHLPHDGLRIVHFECATSLLKCFLGLSPLYIWLVVIGHEGHVASCHWFAHTVWSDVQTVLVQMCQFWVVSDVSLIRVDDWVHLQRATLLNRSVVGLPISKTFTATTLGQLLSSPAEIVSVEGRVQTSLTWLHHMLTIGPCAYFQTGWVVNVIDAGQAFSIEPVTSRSTVTLDGPSVKGVLASYDVVVLTCELLSISVATRSQLDARPVMTLGHVLCFHEMWMFENLIVRQHMQVQILFMIDAHWLIVIWLHLLKIWLSLWRCKVLGQKSTIVASTKTRTAHTSQHITLTRSLFLSITQTGPLLHQLGHQRWLELSYLIVQRWIEIWV